MFRFKPADRSGGLHISHQPSDISHPPEAAPKVWTLTSILLSVLNVAGLLLGAVAIWGFNLWIRRLVADFDGELPALSVWVLGRSLLELAAAFGLLAAIVGLGEVFVKNKKATTALNIVVAVWMGVVLLVWMVAVIAAFWRVAQAM